MRRTLVVGLALAAAALWSAPAVLAKYVVPLVLDGFQLGVDLDHVRPLWPLGLSADELELETGARRLDLEAVRLDVLPGSLRLVGQVGGGRIETQAAHRGDLGLLYVRDVRLESLPLEGAVATLAPVGRLTGAGRWRTGDEGVLLEASLQVRDGSVLIPGAFGISLEFSRLELFGWRGYDQTVHVEHAALESDLARLTARGDVAPNGRLELEVEVQRLEEPLRSLLGVGPLDPRGGPVTLSVQGSLAAPRMVPIRRF